MASKECTLCFNTKTYQEFYKDRHTKDGYSSACKGCRSRQIAKAAKRRRLKGLVSEESRSLLESNEKYLSQYLHEYRLRKLRYLVIPVWLKGAFQPNVGGIYLNHLDNSYMQLSIYTAQGGTHYAIREFSIHQLAQILTDRQYEVLSPEKVSELKISGIMAI